MINTADKIIYIDSNLIVGTAYFAFERSINETKEYFLSTSMPTQKNPTNDLPPHFYQIVKYDDKFFKEINKVLRSHITNISKIMKYFDNDVLFLESLLKNINIRSYKKELRNYKWNYRKNYFMTFVVALLNLFFFDVCSYFENYQKYMRLINEKKNYTSQKEKNHFLGRITLYHGDGTSTNLNDHIENKIQEIDEKLRNLKNPLADSSRYLFPLLISIIGLIIALFINSQKDDEINKLNKNIIESQRKIDIYELKIKSIEQYNSLLQSVNNSK